VTVLLAPAPVASAQPGVIVLSVGHAQLRLEGQVEGAALALLLAAGAADMRAGMNGLAAKAQTALTEDPFSGHVFLFRGRCGAIISE